MTPESQESAGAGCRISKGDLHADVLLFETFVLQQSVCNLPVSHVHTLLSLPAVGFSETQFLSRDIGNVIASSPTNCQNQHFLVLTIGGNVIYITTLREMDVFPNRHSHWGEKDTLQGPVSHFRSFQGCLTLGTQHIVWVSLTRWW